MDIYEFAMKMELDGQGFYEKQAATTKDKQLKEILLSLAEEEKNHYQIFKRLRDNQVTSIRELATGNDTLNKVKNIFVEMSQTPGGTSFGEDAVAAWTEALHIEEKSVAFYTEKAQAETDTEKKNILEKIAEEERTHIHMIDGVLTFLKFPDAFAESAQFKNFQSLEGH